MKWSFQLLLAVVCTETEDCLSPIVTNTFLRDEDVLVEYPFEFSVMRNTVRQSSTGRFIESKEGIRFESGLFGVSTLEWALIEAIISRDKLQRA